MKSKRNIDSQLAYYESKLKFEIDPSDLFEALSDHHHVIAVDTRNLASFEAEHIPGAIHIPHRDMNEETTKNLDKDMQYVTYCDGIGCNGSTKGAINMTKLGFKVKELTGGIEWWKLDGYATEGSKSTGALQLKCNC